MRDLIGRCPVENGPTWTRCAGLEVIPELCIQSRGLPGAVYYPYCHRSG